MEKETLPKLIETAEKKLKLLKSSPLRYLVYAMMAGMYVGLAIILIYSIGAPVWQAKVPFLKTLMGASFGVALSLVIFAGSDLFTGNNMLFVVSTMEKKTTWLDTLKVWFMSYFGNFAGAILVASIMAGTGLLHKAPLSTFIVDTSLHKMEAPFWELFFKGVLCNTLVCLAVWISYRAKHEVAKLIMIFWCLFAFISSGYEHSIANMTLLTMSLFAPHDPNTVSVIGMFHNLIPVTLGNVLGGALFLGFGYWFVSQDKHVK